VINPFADAAHEPRAAYGTRERIAPKASPPPRKRRRA
jgi:hypothetical protein